jgi:hypothetical protein
VISDKKIRKWATVVETQSTLKIGEFRRRALIYSARATTHITFTSESQEYHVWILPELNLIIWDVFHNREKTDELLFRGEITDQALDRIAQILKSA